MGYDRSMRRATAAGFAAFAVVALGARKGTPAPASARSVPAGPSVGSAATRPCVPRNAHVLAHDREVRVYELRPKHARRDFEPPTIDACLAGHTGHMTLLAPDPHITFLRRGLDRFRLAGRILGYVESRSGVDSGTLQLTVVDVAARRVLRSLEAGSWGDAGIISRVEISGFVLTSGGSVAWMTERTDHRQLVEVAVHGASREGPPSLLEAGPDIDPGSLSLSGSTLGWTRAGALHHVPMP